MTSYYLVPYNMNESAVYCILLVYIHASGAVIIFMFIKLVCVGLSNLDAQIHD